MQFSAATNAIPRPFTAISCRPQAAPPAQTSMLRRNEHDAGICPHGDRTTHTLVVAYRFANRTTQSFTTRSKSSSWSVVSFPGSGEVPVPHMCLS
jgi:hypothetical protein